MSEEKTKTLEKEVATEVEETDEVLTTKGEIAMETGIIDG